MIVSQAEKCFEMNKIQFHSHVHFLKCRAIYKMTRTHICDIIKWLSSVMHVAVYVIFSFYNIILVWRINNNELPFNPKFFI